VRPVRSRDDCQAFDLVGIVRRVTCRGSGTARIEETVIVSAIGWSEIAQLVTARAIGWSEIAQPVTARAIEWSEIAQLVTLRAVAGSEIAQLVTLRAAGGSEIAQLVTLRAISRVETSGGVTLEALGMPPVARTGTLPTHRPSPIKAHALALPSRSTMSGTRIALLLVAALSTVPALTVAEAPTFLKPFRKSSVGRVAPADREAAIFRAISALHARAFVVESVNPFGGLVLAERTSTDRNGFAEGRLVDRATVSIQPGGTVRVDVRSMEATVPTFEAGGGIAKENEAEQAAILKDIETAPKPATP